MDDATISTFIDDVGLRFKNFLAPVIKETRAKDEQYKVLVTLLRGLPEYKSLVEENENLKLRIREMDNAVKTEIEIEAETETAITTPILVKKLNNLSITPSVSDASVVDTYPSVSDETPSVVGDGIVLRVLEIPKPPTIVQDLYNIPGFLSEQTSENENEDDDEGYAETVDCTYLHEIDEETLDEPVHEDEETVHEDEEEETVHEDEETVNEEEETVNEEEETVHEDEETVATEEEDDPVLVQEAEDDEVFEVTLPVYGRVYTTNEENGKIYAISADDDVGPEIGYFKAGIPTIL
jgi:hypothetical protein